MNKVGTNNKLTAKNSCSKLEKDKVSTLIPAKTKMKLNLKYQVKPEQPKIKNKTKRGLLSSKDQKSQNGGAVASKVP